MDNNWYARVFAIKTGAVVDELPLVSQPVWLQQVNADGSFTVTTPIGGNGGLSKRTLRGYVAEGRFGVAVCWGSGGTSDWIAQAGPIWSYAPDEGTNGPPTLQIGGSGFWGLLKARLQVPGTWTPSMGISGTNSTANYGPSSMHDIARSMLLDTLMRDSLPLDVPAAAGSGTNVRNFPGYDLAMMGQRLYELTQDIGGPDVVFQPYFASSNLIRFQALIGNPYLVQAGDPLIFDYRSNLTSLKAPSDGSKLSITTYEKGNGVEASTLFAYATDTTLTNAGWPLLESVDSSHASVTDQATLQGWANSVQTQFGRPIETWVSTILMDSNPQAGTYSPGVTATYNVAGHPWLEDGQYSQRILGLQNGTNVDEMVHILDAKQGVV